MILVESIVAALLRPLVANRVHNDEAPAGTQIPYIVIERAGGKYQDFLDGEPMDTRNARIQVDVVAASRAEASTIGQQVEDAFVRAGYEPLGAPMSRHDSVTKMYGTTQDFDVWWNRTPDQ